MDTQRGGEIPSIGARGGGKEMDWVDERTLRIVGECNGRKERIFGGKIATMLKDEVSRSVVYERIRHLVKNGDLIGEFVINGQSRCMDLYIPKPGDEKQTDRRIKELDAKVDVLMTRSEKALKALGRIEKMLTPDSRQNTASGKDADGPDCTQ